MKLQHLATRALNAGAGVKMLQSSPEQCCAALLEEAGLGDKVVTKGQTLWSNRIDSYWSVSAALEPDCMVLPTTAEDVSKIMKVITKNQCKFGIRGGGHGNFALSNSVDEGITVDFGYINGTTYDEEKNIVSVGPGGHWQDVYDTLIPYGLAVAGGRAGTVGVGGFVTGGGNSFYSASHGMTCDTVAGWQVVLANGEIVEANANENADLWQAMKGGSGNLGLITRIDLYPIEFAERTKPVIWGGNLLYKPESGPAAYLPAIAGGTILNAAIENTKGLVKPPAFDAYYSVPDIQADTTVSERLSVVTKELGSGQPPHFRNIWFTSSFKPNTELLLYVVDKYNKLNQDLEALMPSSESGLNTLCMFQPITKAIADKGVANGGNVMGLDFYTAEGDGIMFLLTWAAKGDKTEEDAMPLIQAYIEDIETKAKEMDAFWEWKFINYAHLTQDPLATVGEVALAKLRAASKKYDPEGVFQKLRASGVKIPF
ncbi:hypothetical protein FPOA_04069 [Fusarium poae]|uniref:FAD-binding PCMH-type domain-containing protein n=1 Tax=Fusarium poae TaxID=36050 RepID=A0A1B8ASL4_FUSPO|nr:hypothetical protein FPOA_04069 [Fusarium poae]